MMLRVYIALGDLDIRFLVADLGLLYMQPRKELDKPKKKEIYLFMNILSQHRNPQIMSKLCHHSIPRGLFLGVGDDSKNSRHQEHSSISHIQLLFRFLKKNTAGSVADATNS